MRGARSKKMVSYLKWFVATVFLVNLMACASMQADLPNYDELLKAQTEQNGRQCIRDSDIKGYGVLEDNVVSIDARGRNEYYLLTTVYQCQSLMVSSAAAFVGGFSELCGGGRDKIFTGDDSCPIKSIFKFESQQQAFAAFDQAKETRNQIKQQFEQQKAKGL